MASRYHINGEGNVGECSAAKGQCPFGGADAHFGSREQAEHAAEEQLTAQYGLTATAKKEKKVDVSKLSVEERRSLGMDERTSPEILAELAEDKDEGVRRAVAANGNTSADTLAELSHDHDEYVLQAVADNINTPAEVLKDMATWDDGALAVARSLNTPEELLAYVAEKSDALRAAVAGNKNAPVRLLSKITYSLYEEPSVSRAVANNPNTPRELLKVLTHHYDEDVQNDAYENLRKRRPRAVSTAENENTAPYILNNLAKEKDWRIRLAVAENPSTPKETLIKLSRDSDYSLRVAVAGNPSTPFPALSRLASDPNDTVAEEARKNLLSRLPWSDNDKEIAEGLLDETRGKESGSYFPSLDALHEAVEAYKEIGATDAFDPNNGEGLTAAFVWAEPVKRD